MPGLAVTRRIREKAGELSRLRGHEINMAFQVGIVSGYQRREKSPTPLISCLGVEIRTLAQCGGHLISGIRSCGNKARRVINLSLYSSVYSSIRVRPIVRSAYYANVTYEYCNNEIRERCD